MMKRRGGTGVEVGGEQDQGERGTERGGEIQMYWAHSVRVVITVLV